MADAPPPRSLPEIIDHLRGVREALEGLPRIVDPHIRGQLGHLRCELKDELAEAERRLRDGE